MLTLEQQNAVLKFLVQTQSDTLASAIDYIEPGNVCDNTVRIYDSACIADVYSELANKYNVDDDNVLSYTFDASDVLDALHALDTEYRDCVVEWLMQYSDTLSVAIFGKTYAQYCAEVEAQFAAM